MRLLPLPTMKHPLKHPFLPLALVGVAASAAAQETVPFPMASLSLGAVPEVLVFEPDRGALGALTALQSVRLSDVPMPAGYTAQLDLRRLDFDPSEVGVYVDGRPSRFAPGDLTLWKGEVVGALDSHVFLALSSRGIYGWIHDGSETTHVSSFAGPDGDWSQARGRLYSNSALEAAGTERGPAPCDTDRLLGGPFVSHVAPPGPPDNSPAPVLELKMAIETDFQLWQVWHDLAAEETYVLALLGALSDRLLSQADIKVTYPYVQFWTTASDPWTSQDGGGNCIDLLDEFRNAWSGNLPNGAHLAHFLSGASLGCGVAYLNVICNQSFGFAVSCCLNGGVTFPVSQGSNTWDFFVFAHESGHNLGSLHTHDYCPPLDECYDNCNGVINCTNQGTNLSYCHLCSGGMNNITTYYHPTVVSVMRAAADSSCIPLYDPSTTQIFYDDFETGSLVSNGWTKVNARRKPNAAHEGGFGAKIRKSGKLERTVDTTGMTDIVVRFWRRTKNYDAGEALRFRYSTNGGSSWTTLEETAVTSWGFVEFQMPSAADNNPNFMILFKSFGGDEGKENSRIDQVEVLGK